MTMKITVSCDYEGCFNEIELDQHAIFNESEQVENKGWKLDPKYLDFHYCKQHKHVLDKES